MPNESQLELLRGILNEGRDGSFDIDFTLENCNKTRARGEEKEVWVICTVRCVVVRGSFLTLQVMREFNCMAASTWEVRRAGKH